jgi:hypothetical protein
MVLSYPPILSQLPAGYPTLETLSENGWLSIPRTRAVSCYRAASRNDPLGRIDRRELARMGRRFVVGEVGHLNPAAGMAVAARVELPP